MDEFHPTGPADFKAHKSSPNIFFFQKTYVYYNTYKWIRKRFILDKLMPNCQVRITL